MEQVVKIFSQTNPYVYSWKLGVKYIIPLYVCIDAVLINIYDIYVYQQGDIIFVYKIWV